MNPDSRLLVIDDELGICEGIRRALEPEGFQVEIALDPRAGLDLVRQGAFDLVLLDVKMPEISGLDLIGMIHEFDPEMICIIITGYATIEMAASAIKKGAYDFLTKPFSINTLLLAVNQGLERRRLSLEARRAAQAEAEAQALAEEKNRLLALDQAKRQFIQLVTHELKAPVSAIETYLTLILKGYAEPEKQTEILEKCIARAQEERKLIDDLLELGQLEVVAAFQTSPVNLGDVLLEVASEYQDKVQEKELELTLERDQGLPTILAVPEQIKSVWGNLISNAIKYTPARGRIKASIRQNGSELVGVVEDSGIGILPQDRSLLFSEFYRGRNAKALGLPGTGLGLTIVKRILESLEGTISVESEPDAGARFEFRIPI